MLRSKQTKNYYIYHMVYGRGSLKKNQIREFHFSKDNNNSLRPESTCIYLFIQYYHEIQFHVK